MNDDLVKRLSEASYLAFEDGTNDHGAPSEAADRIAELEAANDQLRNALTAAVAYMEFNSDLQSEPYPLDKCRAALTSKEQKE